MVCLSARADEPNLPLIGKIKPRSAKAIRSSSWSVGGETLDRDFVLYDSYRKHLGQLGAKAIRLQAGWAKCEQTPGVYDWKWLDAVVDDARAQGVQPWLQLSYGNRLYMGGDETGLAGGFPASPEALVAWDRWVRAAVTHFKNRVYQWEVWNEPDLNETGTAPVSGYIDLYTRTASIIREIQPKGKSQIYALALCYKLDYAEKFLTGMIERSRLDLVDAVTIHTYPENPDNTGNIDQLRAMIAKTGYAIPVRQGETGAPSKFQPGFALKNLPFTETMQAKWNLRRMLAHHGKDVPFSLFSMMDLHYKAGAGVNMNYKGLIASKPDKSFDYLKPSYFAAQNVFAIFDSSWTRLKDFSCTASVSRPLASSAYTHQKGGSLVALWFKDAMPEDAIHTVAADITLNGVMFTEPVYIDLLTGKVYALPKPTHGSSFVQIPLFDSPILIAEKSAIPLALNKK